MAGNDIGVTFIPSAANQLAQGTRQGASEGDLTGARSSDLGTAFKILSLRLPSVVSATAPTSSALLKSPGASGLPGAPPAPATGLPGMRAPNASLDPMAAVFAALLRAMQFGGAAPVGGGGSPDAVSSGVPAPKVTLSQAPTQDYLPSTPSAAPIVPSAPAPPDLGGAAPDQQEYQSWAGSY